MKAGKNYNGYEIYVISYFHVTQPAQKVILSKLIHEYVSTNCNFLIFLSWHVQSMKIHRWIFRKGNVWLQCTNKCLLLFLPSCQFAKFILFEENIFLFSSFFSESFAGRSIHIFSYSFCIQDRETFIFLQCAIAIMSLHYGHVSKRKKTKKLHICYRKFPFRVFQLIFTFLIKRIFLLFQCFPILIEFPF